ncbi:unnamed protein product [Pedinophyceae sp. YPF-701]|nr:unnamed protein product [Pedinophyceae sp. YPF-701]
MSDDHELRNYLAVAESAARSAGQVIATAFSEPKNVLNKKNDADLVTQTDQQCEKLAVDQIRLKFPQHSFIGEEEAAALGRTPPLTDAPTWIIDPLDGTTNFVHGFPFVCTCIGLAINKVVVLGVVYNPILDEMFTAVRGAGAFLNGKPIKVSSQANLGRALVATEIGVSQDEETQTAVFDRLANLGRATRSMRCSGSCAMNLCGVAMGRLDAFYEIGFGGPWDVAAASVILEEAGGHVLDPFGGPFDVMSCRVLGTNGVISQAVAEILAASKRSLREPQP